MENVTKIPVSISYLNQIKPLAEDATDNDKKKHGRKLELIPHVENFISTNERFGGDVQITFSHSGVSSLVCILDNSKEKFVLKIPITSSLSDGESDCLKAWESVGVSVPEVIDEGLIHNHPYILMSFVDAKRLADCTQEELAGKEISLNLGKTLRQMHGSKAEGYGRIKDHKAEYQEFTDWLQDSSIQNRIKYVKKEKILDDEVHGSIDQALKILIDFVEKNPGSTYCHNDFGRGNTFNTDPITVFDPNPLINHPVTDISRSIVLTATGSSNPNWSIEQMLKGYYGDEFDFDRRAFQAGVLLNAYTKIYFWHKSGYFHRVERIKKYLAETKYLLHS